MSERTAKTEKRLEKSGKSAHEMNKEQIANLHHDMSECDQAETSPMLNQILLNALMDALPDHVYFKDTKGRFIKLNEAVATWININGGPGSAVGKTDFDIFTEEHAQQAYLDEQEIIKTGQPMIAKEEKETWADGKETWVATTKAPLRDQHGRIIGTVGFSRDITKRKRIEQELQQYRKHLEELVKERTSELTSANEQLRREIDERKQMEKALAEERNLLRTLIDNLPDLIYVKDTQNRFLLGNTATMNSVGVASIENLNGKTDFDLHSKEAATRYYADEQEIFESGHPLLNREETIFDQRTNRATWLLTTKIPFWDSQHNLVGLVGIGRDITNLKQAEEELRKHRDHLEELVKDRTAELLCTNTTLQETIEHLQKTQTQLIQAEKMAALGQLVANIAHEINNPLGVIRASTENITTALHETTVQLPQIFRCLSPEQQDLFVSLVNRALQPIDVLTTRERRQKRQVLCDTFDGHHIEHADDLADTLCDMGIYAEIELFIPLFQIEHPHYPELSALILQTAYNLAMQHQHIVHILMAVNRAAKVIFALKSYAHYDHSGTIIEAHITQSIETVLTLYENQLRQGVEVIKRYDVIPPIRCYPDELHQVWVNLIFNAIQAMENKGRLEIAISQHQQHIVVCITDSGCGVPEEYKDRIFEPFFTTKPAGEGSGLGLDIARKVVQKHQGRIEMESRPGRTTFCIWLPIIPPMNNKGERG
ncbi:MAG: PAS domain-containing protein [Candidatus Babeliaceae bacterium]|nr:PAS domain-containing protein [Candidatus Babeliaceae bacterium]